MIWSPVRLSKMLSSAVSYLSIATDFSVRCHLEDAFLCSARLYKIAHRSAIRGAKPNRYSGPTTARCPKSSALAEIRMCGRRRFLRLAAGAALLPADRVLRGRKPTVASTPVEHSGCDSEAYPVDSGLSRCSMLSDRIGAVARADTDGEGAVARGIPEVVSR